MTGDGLTINDLLTKGEEGEETNPRCRHAPGQANNGDRKQQGGEQPRASRHKPAEDEPDQIEDHGHCERSSAGLPLSTGDR